ncbi:MAG: DUF6796 family protein [Crocinitomicaceae bacterium]
MRPRFNNTILTGILASLLLLIGDVLFYEGWITPTKDLYALNLIRIPYESLGSLSDWRIYVNVFLALLCTSLYLRSAEIFRFIYYSDQNFEKKWSVSIYKYISVSIGLAHLAYVSIPVAVQAVPDNGVEIAQGLLYIFDTISIAAMVLSVLLSIVYIPKLLMRQTKLPGWTFIFFPAISIPLLIGITLLLPNHIITAVVQGASINIGMLVYFILLLILKERFRR